MKEEEARTKRCPTLHAQVINILVTERKFTRDLADDIYDQANCMGSDCMMWAWDVILLNPECKVNGFVECQYSDSETDGHCGLAK